MKSLLFTIGGLALLAILLAVTGPFVWANRADADTSNALSSLLRSFDKGIKQQQDHTVQLEGRIIQLEERVGRLGTARVESAQDLDLGDQEIRSFQYWFIQFSMLDRRSITYEEMRIAVREAMEDGLITRSELDVLREKMRSHDRERLAKVLERRSEP